MKVLISGGLGFVGTAAVLALKEAGHEPVVFDRANGDDVCDQLRVRSAVRGCDAVIHLAGMLGTAELFERPHNAVDVNIHGTLNVLGACADNRAQYVGITMPVSGWANVYTATKHCAQDLASAWHRHRGLRVSHVRAFNAYGPGQKHGHGHPRKIVPTFATEAWAGRPIPIWGDGEQTVDLVHVDDIAHVLVDALTYTNDEILDAGTGEPMRVVHVAHLVELITRSDAGMIFLPMRDGENPNTQIAATRPRCPSFDTDKFQATVDSYRP